MDLPKFLLADNSTLPDEIFILHTEYPRFIINLVNDEIEWFDELSEEDEEDELIDEVSGLVKAANDFYDGEMNFYEKEDL
jgi:hypothetical protein